MISVVIAEAALFPTDPNYIAPDKVEEYLSKDSCPTRFPSYQILKDGQKIIDPRKQRGGMGSNWPDLLYSKPITEIKMDLQCQACSDKGKRTPLMSLGVLIDLVKSDFQKPAIRGQFIIAYGCDAWGAVGLSEMQGAIVAVASQANGLESTNREVAPLSSYYSDRTQGPAVVMRTSQTLIKRAAHIEHGDFMAAWLEKHDAEKKVFHYRNGYLTPMPGKEKQAANLVEKYGRDILTSIDYAR